MIKKIIDLDRKSFNNYTGPNEEFKQKNVIFGYNGRGKSSLALGLKETYLAKNLGEDESLRFFDKDYVDENLSFEDPATGERKKIRGVLARFSAKDVKSEEKVKELQGKLVDTEPLESKLSQLITDTRKAIDAIHDRRRGTATIQKRNKEMGLDEVIRLYKEDLNEAKKIEADEDKLSKIEGDNVIGEKIELIKTIHVSDFDGISHENIDEARAVFKRSFENVSIPASEVVDWLTIGLELHEVGEDCKFCGNKTVLPDITKRVEEYNANEKQKATKSLKAFDDKIAELQNVISDIQDKKANTVSSLEDDIKIENNFIYIQEASVGIANARAVLKSKIKNIDDKKLTFLDFREDLQKFKDGVAKLNGIKNGQLTKLEIQNSNKNILVKGSIGLEIANDSTIQDKLSDIKTVKQDIEKTSSLNKALNTQIQQLKQAESATADFAVYISEILANLNTHLKLIVSEDGKNYIIRHTKTKDPITIADISEGERNLLALLFFYYELFDDSEQNIFKDSTKLIVIDDPISSVDDINRMYIIELMRQVLAISAPQVFIMTHSWDDFTNMCFRLKDKSDTPNSFFEIKKDVNGNSLIAKTRSNILPYHHNFIEVYEFSQRVDTTKLDDCDIYHMPNIIRQVLEGFLRFKVRNSSPTKSNEIDIGRVLFDKEWPTITESEKTKLGQLLLVVNVNSHGSSRSPDEVLQSAKLLMKRVKDVDPRHYNTNKEPIA
jgi:wobble nucleotide-excising tRNase